MKLYFSKGACSLAVRITLNELNITATFEAVNLKTKQTENNNNFFAINPKGSVPVLVLDNKEILTENVAIQIFLAETYDNGTLLPTTGMDRYRVLEGLSFVSSELHKAFSPLFNQEIPEDSKEKFFVPILKKKLEFLNKNLENKSFCVNDAFSIVDPYLFVILTWLKHFRIDLKDYSNLNTYFSKLKNRNSIQKSLMDENISL